MCEKLGLPWLIVSWPSGIGMPLFEPGGWTAPLVGRQFAHGVHDCFAIIRDGMRHYAGINIADFDRDWIWWNTGGRSDR